tara:strand:+ start:2855 stop:3739 length:885 start_codon:yes stop_codon:yes gene_type:complete
MKNELIKQLELLKEFFYLFLEFLSDLLLVRWTRYVLNKKWLFVILVLVANASYYYGREGWIAYSKEFDRLNAEAIAESAKTGMTFEMIADGLYTMTGGIEESDCERIVPKMPTDGHFTVILESPGGNLAEGSCLAAHIKLRNVTTVVRTTPVFDENNKVIYTPGLVGKEDSVETSEDKVMCASACGLLFLGGDSRYLIGDVWFGIHGPSTPPGGNINAQQSESSAYQTASKLLDILEKLGIDDADTRRLFIQIPGYTMYWLRPTEFELREGLADIATHYRDFWGYTNSDNEAAL